MLKIAFLQDNHNHPSYTGASLRRGGIGGTESSVIQLAEALAARGHTVFALNRLESASLENGVRWMPLSAKATLPALDAAIGINSTRIFWDVPARRKIAWFHNPPTPKQQLKRRNLFALLRHRPHAVLLGAYHASLLPAWLPYDGRSTISHGIGAEFFPGEPETHARASRAIFTSQPSRGLDFVVEAWREVVARLPEAELHVFSPLNREKQAAEACAGVRGIILRGSVARSELAKELRLARVMLVPGVADETFCLAAAEATASGVPIVTRGDGALSERVKHGETGFIAKSKAEFAEAAIRVLSDDALWQRQHRACLADRSLAGWPARAEEWETLLSSLLARL